MYIKGQGVNQDYHEACRLLKIASDMGHALATGSLAVMYADGKGVKQDNHEACRLYKIASDMGFDVGNIVAGCSLFSDTCKISKASGPSPEELCNTGLAHFDEAEYFEAAKVFNQASVMGHTNAKYHLGSMYENSLGVTQDYNKALSLYRQAADQGHENAIKHRDELAAKMEATAEQAMAELLLDEANSTSTTATKKKKKKKKKQAHGASGKEAESISPPEAVAADTVIAEDAMPPPHAYQTMTTMANQALQDAMDTEIVTEIAAALEEHHLYCHLQLVQEARVLRDSLKKAAKKAKKQMQKTPLAVVAEMKVEASPPCDEADNNVEVCDMPATMSEPEPQEETEDDDTLCVICLGEEKSHIMAPCGHRCLCAGCANRMVFPASCPMCRRVCAVAFAMDAGVGY